MKYNFFCDENITHQLEETIKKYGFQVSSIRSKKLFGMKNSDLITFLNAKNFTLITFDKDFLNSKLIVKQGIIIFDVQPNRDEFVLPIMERFLKMLEKEEIDFSNKKIVLNEDFF